MRCGVLVLDLPFKARSASLTNKRFYIERTYIFQMLALHIKIDYTHHRKIDESISLP